MRRETKLTFAGRKILLDNADIDFRNFSGKVDDFNRDGKRKFTVIIEDEEIANALIAEGANVKWKEAKERWELEVQVSYRFFEPAAYLLSGRNRKTLNESNIGMLDVIDIERVDMDITLGKEWSINGRTARTAYLDKIRVVQEINRFEAEFAEEEYPEE